MIDPLTNLSFAVQSNPGVYALLLGSGVSRSAQIPTGWEVVLDLIGKLAAAEGADTAGDPAAWYREAYGREPDYSHLLEALCNTEAERQQLLRGYFEPDEEDDDGSAKRPTAAHRAVARLVKGGFVRVVVTTNFDRLTEQAIQDEGVAPSVAASPDAVDGMVPLAHQKCLVVKLHGDYLDTRIKNTPAELDEYDPRMRDLLARIADEFGLIVCGWSGQSDTALCRVLEGIPSRRYTLFWAARGKPGNPAAGLIRHRAGVLVPIEGADQFFPALAERVEAIEATRKPNPLTVAAARATAAKYLSQPKGHVRLRGLLRDETEKSLQVYAPVKQAFGRVRQADDPEKGSDGGSTALLLPSLEVLLAAGLEVVKEPQPAATAELVRSLEQLGRDVCVNFNSRGSEGVFASQYVVGSATWTIAALAEGYFDLAVRLLREPAGLTRGKAESLLQKVEWHGVYSVFEKTPEGRGKTVPMGLWMEQRLREPLRGVLPSDERFSFMFRRFEILRAVMFLHEYCGGKYDPTGSDLQFSTLRGIFMVEHQWHTGSERDQLGRLMKDEVWLSSWAAAGVCGGDRHQLERALRLIATQSSKRVR